MKKAICVLICAVMMLSLFTACGSKKDAAAPTDSADTITITDHAGNEVTLPKTINRIAVCGIYPMPSVLSVFFNSAEKIVAMPDVSMAAAKNGLLGQLYPEILKAQTDCVSGKQVNTEELLKLNPDVVFYGASDTDVGEALRTAGFNSIDQLAMRDASKGVGIMLMLFGGAPAGTERPAGMSSGVPTPDAAAGSGTATQRIVVPSNSATCNAPSPAATAR